MEINSLVERIENIRILVQSEGSNAEIFDWLNDCQGHLETSHNKLELTKQFIKEKENFKSNIIGFKSYSLDNFDSLASTIRSVKKIEDKNEKNKPTPVSFAKLNQRDDVPRRPTF